jgi:hypothetical protein
MGSELGWRWQALGSESLKISVVLVGKGWSRGWAGGRHHQQAWTGLKGGRSGEEGLQRGSRWDYYESYAIFFSLYII